MTCLQKKERLLQPQGCLVVFFHLPEITAQKASLLVVLQQTVRTLEQLHGII